MKDKKVIQEYINNFRRRIAQFLKPSIGLTCHVYSAESGGAILEFTMGPGIANDDIYKEISPTINYALSQIKQRAFGGNFDAFKFAGTNMILEENRIIFIKDDSSEEWSDSTASRDVSRLLQPPGSAPP
ncbi:MAG: hypothetical protein NTY86_03000 [Deltaproteobacteria bacterium]|nr:hypothetical protein [Deltaproteobacteria bacterium]